MMTGIFLAMGAALAFGWSGLRGPAIAAAGVSLALAAGLFLWEVYSPETGFRMPWIDTRLTLPAVRLRG
jgi:hypothetical protein